MSERIGRTTFVLITLLVFAAGCSQCGARTQESGPSEPKKSLAELISGLEAAATKRPQDALPDGLQWAMTSPDAAAYQDWAKAQPFVQRFEKTALYRELMTHETVRALNQFQKRVARAAALTGTDESALWAGPLAIGLATDGDRRARVVAIKAVAPEAQTFIRFTGTFVELVNHASFDDNLKLRSYTESGHLVYTLERTGRPIIFSLFSNLAIIGNDAGLVRAAVKRATGADKSETVQALAGAWSSSGGVHIARMFDPSDLAGVVGWPSATVSLMPDAAAPVQIRRKTEGRAKASTPAALSRYIPKDSAFVMVDAELDPSRAFAQLAARLPGLSDPASTGGVDLADAVFKKLKPGAVAALNGSDGTLIAHLVFAHADRAGLQDALTTLARTWGRGEVTRTQTADGDSVISIGPSGPAVALTDDAVVFGRTMETTRQALRAARGTAPSLVDRSGWPKEGDGAILIDFARAAPMLGAFYANALGRDGPSWQPLLGEVRQTFEALATAGTLCGAFVRSPEGLEGTLRVVP